jgi:L-2-hydroxyglutarate oxidase LhgO
LLNKKQLASLVPTAKLYGDVALCIQDTALVNPESLLNCLVSDLKAQGVRSLWNASFIERADTNALHTTLGRIDYDHCFNCAGQDTLSIAQHWNIGEAYQCIALRGLFYRTMQALIPGHRDVSVFPVPTHHEIFFGPHVSPRGDGGLYVGPMMIFDEGHHHPSLIQQVPALKQLALFSDRVYRHQFLQSHLSQLFSNVDMAQLAEMEHSVVRPQLVHLESSELVSDAVIASHDQAVHALNTITPAFTCAFPMAKLICDHLQVYAR